MHPDPDVGAASIDVGGKRPNIGIVLGSGLGEFANRLQDSRNTPFALVPGIPAASVIGHAGTFVVGSLGNRRVVVMRGRIHTYEGHSAATVAYPIRVLAALGCTTLIVTNAAGGINPNFQVGDLMAIVDHLNLPGLSGNNPLIGATGDRFVDMVNAYDPALIDLAESVSREFGQELRRGVYAMVSGPSFETRAELRFLRAVGVDAVGMSTAPEVIVARQLGLRVLGISCITNQASPDTPTPVNHEDVLATGQAVQVRFGELLAGILPRL